jgi:hypothetical protein
MERRAIGNPQIAVKKIPYPLTLALKENMAIDREDNLIEGAKKVAIPIVQSVLHLPGLVNFNVPASSFFHLGAIFIPVTAGFTSSRRESRIDTRFHAFKSTNIDVGAIFLN